MKLTNPFKQLRMTTKGENGKPYSVRKLGKKLGISASCIVSWIESEVGTLKKYDLKEA